MAASAKKVRHPRRATPRILSVRLDARHWGVLQRIMRRHGLDSESEATRYLIEKEGEEQEALSEQQAAARDVIRRIRAMNRNYRGPRNVRASEDHDEFLGRLRE